MGANTSSHAETERGSVVEAIALVYTVPRCPQMHS